MELFMKRFLSTFFLLGAVMSAFAESPGIVTVPSTFSVSETVQRLKDAAKAKDLIIFANIDFSHDAAQAGLSMNEAQLLIFGNPKGGTPIMQAVPLAALDLPLKILAWQDGGGKVWISYNAPEYLRERYGLSEELGKPFASVGNFVNKAIQAD